jgi:hypothetical protein
VRIVAAVALLLVMCLAACDPTKCPRCRGAARIDCTSCENGTTDCGVCVGGRTGGSSCRFCKGEGVMPCEVCKGKGTNTCFSCGGTGGN